MPCIDSLAPEKFDWNLKKVIFKLNSVIDAWGVSCEIVIRLILLGLTDDKSTLVRVMALYRQATSHSWPNIHPDLCRHVALLGYNVLSSGILWYAFQDISYMFH